MIIFVLFQACRDKGNFDEDSFIENEKKAAKRRKNLASTKFSDSSLKTLNKVGLESYCFHMLQYCILKLAAI